MLVLCLPFETALALHQLPQMMPNFTVQVHLASEAISTHIGRIGFKRHAAERTEDGGCRMCHLKRLTFVIVAVVAALHHDVRIPGTRKSVVEIRVAKEQTMMMCCLDYVLCQCTIEEMLILPVFLIDGMSII